MLFDRFRCTFNMGKDFRPLRSTKTQCPDKHFVDYRCGKEFVRKPHTHPLFSFSDEKAVKPLNICFLFSSEFCLDGIEVCTTLNLMPEY